MERRSGVARRGEAVMEARAWRTVGDRGVRAVEEVGTRRG